MYYLWIRFDSPQYSEQMTHCTWRVDELVELKLKVALTSPPTLCSCSAAVVTKDFYVLSFHLLRVQLHLMEPKHHQFEGNLVFKEQMAPWYLVVSAVWYWWGTHHLCCAPKSWYEPYKFVLFFCLFFFKISNVPFVPFLHLSSGCSFRRKQH